MSATSAKMSDPAQAAASTGGGAIATLEGVAQVTARRLECRAESNEEARTERDTEREQRHAKIDANFGHARKVGRADRNQSPDERARDEQAERAADDAEHGGLGQQLRDDASA